MRYLLAITLAAATLSFALGLTLPLIRVQRLVFLSDEPSLLAMIASLWTAGEWALAGLIAMFSVVFPAAKLVFLNAAAFAAPGAAMPRWFRAVSNWSMLDVVLVAIVIFAARTSGMATAFTKPGLWFFAASVVLTVVAAALVRRREAGAGNAA